MNYKSFNPYPDINVEKKNFFYAKLLLEDYTGITSELSSITQYIYQNFNLFKINPYISKALEEIAIVEMKHLALLGKTIKLLGINPKYKTITNKGNVFWNSSFINYSINIKQLLIDNINIEKRAINNYKLHIAMIDDKYIKNLLKRIIEDEEVHIECFNSLLKNLK